MIDSEINSNLFRQSNLDALEAWFLKTARPLPWRQAGNGDQEDHSSKGRQALAYRRMVSEFLLQQTVASVAQGYYLAIMERWPTIHHIAAATLDDVLFVWRGLGYYRRAQYLWQTAKIVCDEYDGIIPSAVTELRKLPGVGSYTASAIAAFAFQQPCLAIDTNVLRLLARFHALTTVNQTYQAQISHSWQKSIPSKKAGIMAEAMIELGAVLCRARLAECQICPLQADCQGKHQPQKYPQKPVAKARPERLGIFFALRDQRGSLIMQRLGVAGVLANTWMMPSTRWRRAKTQAKEGDSCPNELFWRIKATGHERCLDDIAALLMARGLEDCADIQNRDGAPAEKQDQASATTTTGLIAKLLLSNDVLTVSPFSHVFTHFKLNAVVVDLVVPTATLTRLCSSKEKNFHILSQNSWDTIPISTLAKKCLTRFNLNQQHG